MIKGIMLTTKEEITPSVYLTAANKQKEYREKPVALNATIRNLSFSDNEVNNLNADGRKIRLVMPKKKNRPITISTAEKESKIPGTKKGKPQKTPELMPAMTPFFINYKGKRNEVALASAKAVFKLNWFSLRLGS
jgi:hypothetical protein